MSQDIAITNQRNIWHTFLVCLPGFTQFEELKFIFQQCFS